MTPSWFTQPESSQALNFGFRAGFLGLFHMEIIQERLEREYNLDILATAPSVEYRVLKRTAETALVDSPALLPDENIIEEIQEPWMKIQIYVPQSYIGSVMDLVINKRGTYETTEYLDASRVILHFEIPVVRDHHRLLRQAQERDAGYAASITNFMNTAPAIWSRSMCWSMPIRSTPWR